RRRAHAQSAASKCREACVAAREATATHVSGSYLQAGIAGSGAPIVDWYAFASCPLFCIEQMNLLRAPASFVLPFWTPYEPYSTCSGFGKATSFSTFPFDLLNCASR